jgi:LysM repeat protein
MATSEHASGQLLLVISTLLIAALELHLASAQQQYNNVTGYTCTGVSQTCSASAYYRTQGTNSTLNSTATRFNTTAAAIASASALNTTSSNALLPADTSLTVPLACTSRNRRVPLNPSPHSVNPTPLHHQIAGLPPTNFTPIVPLCISSPALTLLCAPHC